MQSFSALRNLRVRYVSIYSERNTDADIDIRPTGFDPGSRLRSSHPRWQARGQSDQARDVCREAILHVRSLTMYPSTFRLIWQGTSSLSTSRPSVTLPEVSVDTPTSCRPEALLTVTDVQMGEDGCE